MKLSEPKEGVRPTILVAEDDADQVLLLRREFERQKFKAHAYYASDGVEALAYLQGTGVFRDRTRFPMPNLVLLDLKMPRKDGFEVLSAMKADPALARIPVVVLTVSERLRDVNQAYQLGARTFMVKPIDFTELIRICQTLCPQNPEA